MKLAASLLPAALIGLAAAGPTRVERATTNCGQWDSVVTGGYTIYNDLWNEGTADAGGSQCVTVNSLSGSTLSWATTWTWTGGAGQVKSYANAVATLAAKQLSAISAIPSTWAWSYTGSDIVADVAYDMFTSSSAGGSDEYEVMVWLAALGGAGPISSTYGSDGNPTPIATATIAGHSFKLYKGPNGSMTVFSFVPTSQINSFSGDMMDFFDYLTSKEGLSTSQYLVSAGAGTEAFTGTKATFTTSKYSLTLS